MRACVQVPGLVARLALKAAAEPSRGGMAEEDLMGGKVGRGRGRGRAQAPGGSW